MKWKGESILCYSRDGSREGLGGAPRWRHLAPPRRRKFRVIVGGNLAKERTETPFFGHFSPPVGSSSPSVEGCITCQNGVRDFWDFQKSLKIRPDFRIFPEISRDFWDFLGIFKCLKFLKIYLLRRCYRCLRK